MSVICAGLTNKGKVGVFKEEGKPQVVLPFCPPPWVRRRPRRGRGESPRSAERSSPLRFSEKLSAR